MFNKLWYKFFGGRSKSWVEFGVVNEEIVIKDYNKAYVNNLRKELGTISDDLSDKDVVNLKMKREEIEIEPPKLNIKHAGIDSDGKIKMELDWNTSFIKHLNENGIFADSGLCDNF